MSEKKDKSKKKKQDGILLAIWLLAVLVIILIFVIKWPTISENINNQKNKHKNKTPTESVQTQNEKSDLSQNIQTEIPEEVEINLNENSEISSNEKTSDSENNIIEETEQIKDLQTESEEKVESEKIETKVETEKETVSIPQEKITQEKPKSQKRNLTLYFIDIDLDGSIIRKPVVKSVEKSDSPLTDSIKLLLQGPSTSEKCKTLIPEGTKLIGASVKNGIATLNFNEAFIFNQNFGSDGYSAQLQQIVFTATEFPTVNSVQFLIEGEKKDFLVEGLWIGTPLSRANF